MKSRGNLLIFFTILTGLVFIVKLFYLQISSDKYKNKADGIAIKKEFIFPERGYIYDRNNVLLVANQTSYDVMIIPKKVKALDTLQFCKLLKITKEDFIKRHKRAKRFSNRLASVFLKQLAKEDYAFLQEKMHKFDGFYIQKRSIRNYPIKYAANVLGYISEVNNTLLKKDKYYHQGELIGHTGIEKQYEKDLRGIKGIQHFQKNKHNKTIGPYKNGSLDTLPVIGNDLTLTIDIVLQQYGEQLMKNKRGAIIALEPSSGEILALITAPSYDPNLMVGRKRSKYSTKFLRDTLNKPMFDRGLKGQYAPGSPFKIVNALIGLQEDVISTDSKFTCKKGHRYGVRSVAFMKCHCGSFGQVSFSKAIYNSCNSFFANTYRKIIEKEESSANGLDKWSAHVKSFGFGNFMGVDLPVGDRGRIPDGKFYNKYYPTFKWKAASTISNAIGQGEVETTPIQLANMTAAVANRGFYYTPHIVKKIKGKQLNSKYTIPKHTSIDEKHFSPVIEGMFEVFEKGTGKYSKVKGLDICGKTGTVQNFIKRNGTKIEMEDHSIFIAFAPKENPKIAIAVFIENGGYGSVYAAPIASLMIEKYLFGKTNKPYKEKELFEDVKLLEEYKKLVTPINENQ
ncbi:MAG: penicillin-binding protein 2 [Flavobacteriaceae bacterium]